MFGASGRFPSIYIGCVMTGQALGGVIPALAAVALIAFDVRPQLLGELLPNCPSLCCQSSFCPEPNTFYFSNLRVGKLS